MAKHFKTILAAVVSMIALASCEQEIADFTNRLDDLESRVSKLEELCAEMNSNISSLQAIVTAMQSGDYITSVNPITSDGMTVGYTITFAKSDPITIYHGQDGADGQDGKDGVNGQDGQNGADGHTPVIGVKQDTDGIWYWTIDGEWLLDSNNQKVKAVGVDGKDGITPQLKIEDGYWFVSVDNGTTWTQMGKATGENGKDGADGKDGKDGVDGKDGDSMFQSVTVTETEVTFVTSDGQTFVIKRASALSIEFDSADLMVMAANATRNIHYTITSGIEDITIEALSSADIKVKVVKNDAKTGALNVKTGAAIDEYSKVVVLVSNGSQAIMRTLNFEEEAIEVEENTTKEVTDEGGEVTLEFFSNTTCKAVIPEEASSWISVAPDTKAMEKQIIQLIVKENIGLPRSATINVVGLDDASFIALSYTISQNVGGAWKDGETIPPDNEIWYTTKYNSIITISSNLGTTKLFDVNVISNTYENGKGIIRCDAPITVINECAFSNSSSIIADADCITNIFLPNSITTIEQEAFYNTTVEELRIPDNLQYVGAYAFVSKNLRRFIGNHTTEDGRCIILQDGYFHRYNTLPVAKVQNCLAGFAPSGLSEYVLPSNIEVIGSNVFAGCSELKSIRFNEGLKTIYDYILDGVNLDCEIYLPSTLEKVEAYAFVGCRGIKGFYGNEKFYTADHLCLTIENYFGEGRYIIQFVGQDLESYSIPDGIVGIEHYAFRNMINLKTVTFPSSITEVKSHVFDGCKNLKAIYGDCTSEDHRGLVFGDLFRRLLISEGITKYTVQNGIKRIGYEAFSGLSDLEELIIPDSVIELGGYDFSYCRNLKKVILSSNLHNIGITVGDYCGELGWNPFLGSSNLEEIYFRSYIPPVYTDTQFQELDCQNLTVYVPEETLELYKKSGWYQYAPYMVGYKYDDIGEWNQDFYISSDYSADGNVTTLQSATVGEGINVILMGDAFSDRQIADGTYAGVMENAMNAFFSEEPFKSMRDCFNVYTVDVVSATEGYEHSGQALSTGFGNGTYVYGNDEKVAEYAQNAIDEDQLDDAVIIVMMNKDAYAGTCFMYYPTVSGDYSRGLSIAYFPVSSDAGTFNGLVSHEAGGHGFAKLGDEYAYESNGAIPQEAIDQVRTWEPYGWWKNVDFTGNLAQVKWAQFIADERYAGENIGCYEGAYTYWTGAWRPTENSIMRYNTGGFNAPSRYAIWYRIGKLAYGEEWNGSYEDFVTYDAINRTPAAAAQREAQRRNFVKRPLQPLAPPVVIGHSWREGFGKE